MPTTTSRPYGSVFSTVGATAIPFFVRVEYRHGAENYTLRISHIDHNTHESFTL